MDPNQTPPSNNPNDPYQFITNPSAPVRHNPFLGGSFVMKLTLIIGVGAFIAIALWIGTSLVSSGNTANTDSLVTIAQQQQEFKRVASLGATQARAQKVRNLGASISLTFTTDQRATLQYLATQGTKVKPATLQLKRSPVTDQQLTAGRNASEFDSVFIQVIQKSLQSYEATVKTSYDSTKGPKQKKLLGDLYAHANLLLQQSNQGD